MPRIAWSLLIVSSMLALSACAPGDVELNGKIFDAMGVGTGSVQKSRNVQIPERQPLLLPPSLEKLPSPEQANAAPQDGSFPVDPEKRSQLSQAELQRQQAEYCKVHYERPKALGDEAKAAVAKGPLGLCAPSILGSTGQIQQR